MTKSVQMGEQPTAVALAVPSGYSAVLPVPHWQKSLVSGTVESQLAVTQYVLVLILVVIPSGHELLGMQKRPWKLLVPDSEVKL